METTDFVIITVTITLSALVLILGIQVFFILKEIRVSLRKINKMLEDMGKVSGTVGESAEHVSTFISGLKAGIGAIASLRGKNEKDD
ncbi:hypothetical protein A2Z33_02415 [Candidatus Gottesmanbacteria bacterium RBG_16_52_11]|uniref:Uncharacterized protein n=1 Tax=Candidatus Gottesmanbacteria bacterium RBG_16_52_11 TaxID=1798374 RepID=A0A1F5YN30_9BACT|nr:MAG: hypothetical protein A2Z33_02415 [Candidatus Gottesmanbacteria bacterium RBG_16_52_11]